MARTRFSEKRRWRRASADRKMPENIAKTVISLECATLGHFHYTVHCLLEILELSRGLETRSQEFFGEKRIFSQFTQLSLFLVGSYQFGDEILG